MTTKRVPALTWTTLILATALLWLLGLVVCGLAGLPIARHHLEAAGIALAVGFCLHVVGLSRGGEPSAPALVDNAAMDRPGGPRSRGGDRLRMERAPGPVVG